VRTDFQIKNSRGLLLQCSRYRPQEGTGLCPTPPVRRSKSASPSPALPPRRSKCPEESNNLPNTLLANTCPSAQDSKAESPSPERVSATTTSAKPSKAKASEESSCIHPDVVEVPSKQGLSADVRPQVSELVAPASHSLPSLLEKACSKDLSSKPVRCERASDSDEQAPTVQHRDRKTGTTRRKDRSKPTEGSKSPQRRRGHRKSKLNKRGRSAHKPEELDSTASLQTENIHKDEHGKTKAIAREKDLEEDAAVNSDKLFGSQANIRDGQGQACSLRAHTCSIEPKPTSHGVLRNSEQSTSTVPTKCIIFTHGAGGCRMDALALSCLELAVALNVHLVTFDCAGSGLSEGDCMTFGYHEKDDVKSVVEFLHDQEPNLRIALWGVSMGAASSLMFAAEAASLDLAENVTCLILDSCFASLPRASRELVSSNIRFPFAKALSGGAVSIGLRVIKSSLKKKAAGFDMLKVRPADSAPKVTVPALFICATDDTLVKPSHSKRLAKCYGGACEILQVPGFHNSIRPASYLDHIAVFLHNHLLTEEDRDKLPCPPTSFGNTCITQGNPYVFIVKQLPLTPEQSHSSEITEGCELLAVGNKSLSLLKPFSEELIRELCYTSLERVWCEDGIYMFVELSSAPYSSAIAEGFPFDPRQEILAFHSIEATEIVSAVGDMVKQHFPHSATAVTTALSTTSHESKDVEGGLSKPKFGNIPLVETT